MIIKNIVEYLETTAMQYPNKISIKEENKTITFLQLNCKSKSIATFFKNKNIIKKPIGVYMPKGIDALCSFFGIVYAGGFYCMLDVDFPKTRLIQIQKILSPEIILTTNEFKEKAKEVFNDCKIYTINEIVNTTIDENYIQNVKSKMIDTNPLYINFTSGSIGNPKGIVVSHRSTIDFIEHFTHIFNITDLDIIANQAPFDFDISVKDIYSSIKTGATLVIVPRHYFSTPTKLMNYLHDNKITTMIWAVSALCFITIFHGLEYKELKTVNKILFSGEIMPYKHLQIFREHLPNATFVNLYGPTEITCNCTYYILEKDNDYTDGIPIGKCFPNEEVFLLDEENKLITDIGKVARIFVRGSALALGYYGQMNINKMAFIQNPLNSNYPEIVYDTGDLGKYDKNFDLIFCGRVDNQIKYMGHRIELEEIENSIMKIEGVNRCFIILDKNQLKAYYLGTINKENLHKILMKQMPIYMIPGYIRKINYMPLSKNGKIDKEKAIMLAEEESVL